MAPYVLDQSLVAQFVLPKTYLNLKIDRFTPLRDEVDDFLIFIYDFSGKPCMIGPLTSNYLETQNRSTNVPITQAS